MLGQLLRGMPGGNSTNAQAVMIITTTRCPTSSFEEINLPLYGSSNRDFARGDTPLAADTETT